MKYFDVNVETTFGYTTKRNRQRLGLEKTHYNDAIAICNPQRIKKLRGHDYFVCKPHGRYKL